MNTTQGPLGELFVTPETAWERQQLEGGPWFDPDGCPFLCECHYHHAGPETTPHLELRYETEMLPEPDKTIPISEFLLDPETWVKWIILGYHLALTRDEKTVAVFCTARTLNREAEPFLKPKSEGDPTP